MKININCLADTSHPCFGALIELAQDVGAVTLNNPPPLPRDKRRKKPWNAEARRKQRWVTYAAIANGRRKASQERRLAARKTLIEAGEGHRLNIAAA